MRPRLFTVAALPFLLTFLTVATAPAQWVEDGTPIRTTTGSWDQAALTLPSGDVIVGFDSGIIGQQDIYLQRIDPLGNALWTPEGSAICTAANRQEQTQIIADGQGGVIVLWDDWRDGTSYPGIYAQRVDGQGNVLWASGGIAVIDTSWTCKDPRLVPDGAGGALITWTDGRGPTNWNFFGQRIDAGGTRLWAAEGVPVVYSNGDSQMPSVCQDGEDGMLLVWREFRTGSYDIYGQRLDGDGNALWGAAGVVVCSAYFDQSYPVLVPAGDGGAIVTWPDLRTNFAWDIYAQRIGSTGGMLWASNGVQVCTANYAQVGPKIVSDGTGGVIIAWEDYRSGSTSNIYAQRLNANGAALWAAGGLAVCPQDSSQTGLAMVADGAGGVVVGWSDDRNHTSTGWDVYAQQLDAGGNPGWDTQGVPLCRVGGNPDSLSATEDGRNGAVFFWNEYRIGGTRNLFAQRAERHGYWGYPGPVISGVTDVPFDQGGKVAVTWEASRLDVYDQRMITFYSVWRRLDAAKAAGQPEAGAARVTPGEIPPDFSGPALWYRSDGGKSYGWEWMANLPAHYLKSYTFTAATMYDSTSGDPALHHFMVAAQTGDPFVFWDSLPDSGGSVDNLAPGVPLDLAGSLIGSDVVLSWAASGLHDEDLLLYNIYRSDQEGFLPGLTNLVGTTADTTFTEALPGVGIWYYRVAGVDVHENVGDPSDQVWVDALSGAAGSVPRVVALRGNYPNPFNPRTVIVYELPQAMAVSLQVFDIGGRLVRILKDGVTEPVGRHDVAWNGCDGSGRPLPSGMYFCRLRADSFEETRRMMLVR